MGFPNRLDGKSVPFPSDRIEICPNCGRTFKMYQLEVEETKVSKICPYCGFEFEMKKPATVSRKKRRK